MTKPIIILCCMMSSAWSYALAAELDDSRLIVQNNTANPRNGEGSLLPLSDGRLYLVYTQWYTERNDDHAPARLVGITSHDQGASWSAPVVVQENSGEMNVMSASLARTESGRILLVYIQIESNRRANLWVKESRDEVRTWSKPARLSNAKSGVVFSVNSSTVKLSSGRILVAAYHSPSAWGKDEHYLSYTYYSDDEGRSWNRSANMVDAPKRGAMEPVVVELADSRVMMLMRTQMGHAYRAFSKDEGTTWEKASPSGIVHPEAPIQIARIPDSDDLVLVWNNAVVPGADHQGPRRPLTIAVSQDQGETWSGNKNLEPANAGSYCYATLAFQNKKLLMAYYAPGGLKFRSITIDHLYR